MSEVLNSLNFKPLFNSIDARPAKPTKCYKKDNKLIFVSKIQQDDVIKLKCTVSFNSRKVVIGNNPNNTKAIGIANWINLNTALITTIIGPNP